MTPTLWILSDAPLPVLPAACDASVLLVADIDAGWAEYAERLSSPRVPVIEQFRRMCAQWDVYRAHLVGCEACRAEAERLRIERMGEG